MTPELRQRLDDFRREDGFEAALALMVALRRGGRADEACDVLDTMLQRDAPPVARAQFGVYAYALGRSQTSVDLLEAALPNLTDDALRMEAMVYLCSAQFSLGRYHQAHPLYRTLRQPNWLGLQWRHMTGGKDHFYWTPFRDRLLYDQPVDGKRIMVVHDQGGYGDLIQMVRYIDELKRQGARKVFVSAPAPIAEVIATKAGAEVCGELLPEAEWDLLCPAAFLYARFQRHPFSPHWDRAYLSAEPLLQPPPAVRAIPPRRAARRRVGVVWRSATDVLHEPFRSMPLSVLAPVLDHAGVDWFSLQVDGMSDEELALLARLNVTRLGDQLHSFADIAQVLQQLDLLISIDTAPVHLAGALGRPVWALLAQVADYRWYDDQRFTPWYATARLFRQERLGDWSNVIEEVSRQVRAL